MTKKKPGKKDTISKSKAAAWSEFSRYIRLRDCLLTTGTMDYGICCTCGTAVNFSRLQAGHFVPGRNNSILFDPRGVHAQCVGCNMYGNGKIGHYYAWMLEAYGRQVIDELFRNAQCSMKLSVPDLREWAARFRGWCKTLQAGGVVDADEHINEIRLRIGR